MNNTQKFNIKRTLLAFMLIAALIGVQAIGIVAYAAETADQQPTVQVSTYEELVAAIETAQDGDVIGILTEIIVPTWAKIGTAEKQVILKKMTVEGRFTFEWSAPDGYFTEITNIVFDGNNLSFPHSFITVNHSTVFSDVQFINNIATVTGGAVNIINGEVHLNNCIFDNNNGWYGGHLSMSADEKLYLDNCMMTNGHADVEGGAIYIYDSSSTCDIRNSLITKNVAKIGGGIASHGSLYALNSKIFDNTALTSADDIYDYGWKLIDEDIETLQEIFYNENIVVKGWVKDRPITNQSSICLKLDYEVKPTEVILAESSLGIAGDSKITGLESGKYYKVSTGDTTNYSNADGTLVLEELEAAPLTGTEITGLTNGETYMVEEFTPAPTSVLLDAASLGTADNEKITGLSAGKMYKVSVDGTVSYSKTDGTLTTSEEDAAALEGTEILGLTNGLTYLVEEYIKAEPTPEPEPEPTPSTVILESSSLGKPGDGKITDLTSGKKYKVSSDGITNYSNSDGTLTSKESDATGLIGTEIIGLINGKTYNVEEYKPTPTEEPKPDPTPTPDPEPSTPPSSNNSGGSGHSQVTKPETNKVKLSYGKVTLDTSKTEYLLGYTDGLMGGKDNVTKAQLVQIVYRLLTPESITAVYSNKNTFKDVASDAWYNEAVSTLANAGLISGNGGKFNPDQDVTWGEMVSILSKFAKPNSEWKIITKHWAKDALNTAISYRWFEYNDQFNPDGVVTRVEMLNFINTMFKWSKQ